jgi:hypothetical protein
VAGVGDSFNQLELQNMLLNGSSAGF